ncbi:unnamed protein product [Mytilus coruscus]|uniref:Uncharacterized protein n=1 Tax=Mytilus coruscus TaxID=42192 RepID=A0A6J8E3T1_MYTCO|nr:unnamed protein product [Mytilus coruscus]
MCQYIVGSEDHVEQLRMMNNIRDNITTNKSFVIITSGSVGEGLVMRCSDLDFMTVMTNIEVCVDTKIKFKPNTTYLKLRTEETPPGLTRLHLVHSDIHDVMEACVEVDGEYFISNIRIKDKKDLTIQHGPCLSDKNGLLDIAICSTKIKYLYLYYLSKIFGKKAHLLPFGHISGNKSTYKQYNTCISTVLKSIRHNAVSGWLLLASFFYKTKQFKKTLEILQYSLSKCTSEKLYHFRNLLNIQYEFLNFNTFTNMPIVQLLKVLRLDCVEFCKNSLLIPDEIQVEGSSSIPPVVLAHFLRFLCYYHITDYRQCQNSLINLQLTIEGNYFVSLGEKAVSYIILGITIRFIGNMDSVRQAFMQSQEFIPDKKIVHTTD